MAQSKTKKRNPRTLNAPKAAPAAITTESAAVGRWFAAADSWLSRRTEWVVWAMVAAGFGLRLARAATNYLNGDEAMTMTAPLQHGLENVYHAMLAHPHGPFPNFLLHFMSFLGSSELWFRMPSVVTGALLPYVAYRWAAATFGKTAGMVTASILAFSPALIILSAQVRFYMIQMFFLAVSLHCLEQAFREKSAGWMRAFGAASVMALLTEYMSILYIGAIGVYALLRILNKELQPRLILEWAGTQAAAVAVLLLGFATHLHRLKGNGGERFAQDVWLRGSYYHREAQGLWDFLRGATDALFGYVFSNAALGTWMFFFFVFGVALLLWGKGGVPGGRRLPGLALVLPFLFTGAAACLPLYPYGGSRHDAFLAIFLAAGIAVAIAFLARWKIVVLLAAAAWLVPMWMNAAQHHVLDDIPQVSKRAQMENALAYLSTRSPKPRVLVADQNGSVTLNYYICHGEVKDWRALKPNMTSYRCGDYRILTVEDWGIPMPGLSTSFVLARRVSPDLFPDPAWGFSVAFNRFADLSVSQENSAVFGKLELLRLPQR